MLQTPASDTLPTTDANGARDTTYNSSVRRNNDVGNEQWIEFHPETLLSHLAFVELVVKALSEMPSMELG